MNFFGAFKKALSSKTVWGAIVLQGAALAGGPITALAAAKAIGTIITVAGGRDALDKAAGQVGTVIAAAQGK